MNVQAPMERVSLGGWIATDEQQGQSYIHAHFSASMVSAETVVIKFAKTLICGSADEK